MIKHLKIFFLFAVFFLFVSCRGLYNQHKLLSDVDDAVYDPGEIFVSGKNLYFSYDYNGSIHYLYAKIPDKNSRKGKKNSVIKVDFIKDGEPDLSSGKEKIVFAKDIFPQALQEALELMAPKACGTGIMVPTSLKDVVLFRDGEGNVKVSDPAGVPRDVSVKGRLSKKRLVKLAYGTIIKYISEKYPFDKKFIIPIDSIPLVPYVYVDIENAVSAAIKLPDFYAIRKDVSPAGFPVGIFYSFVIKSHFFNLIKAPFTSTHRLFSTLIYSLYAGLSPYIEEISGEIPPLNESSEMMDVKAFNRYLDFNVTREVYKGKAEILMDGISFFPDFIEKASKASKSIKVRLYIFKNDPYSLTLADLLKQKSNEGVKVRVLTDEINTVLNFTKNPERLYSKDYVMPDIKKYLKDGSKVKVRTTPNTWANFDHTKTIIIDKTSAYVGGMNFGEEYRYDWHDMMLSLTGPVVIKLDEDFNHTWSYAGPGGDFAAAARGAFKKKPDYKKALESGMYDMRVLYTKPMQAEIFNAQIEAIRRAKKRVYMQNSYFSDARVIQELINARKRGVDVRVILPSENDNEMLGKSNMVKANIMFRNGIKIYFYPKMSHVKAAIYDNWACVGTSNFDKMSLYINSEINFGIDDPGFVEDLHNKLFLKDFAVSVLMKEEHKLDSTDYIMSVLSAQG